MSANYLDEWCMRVAQHDDQAAFQQIFNQFYRKLFLFVKAFLKNKEFSEEVVADVFIKLWQNRKSLPGIKNLNYYLFVTAKHAAFDYLENNKKNQTVDLDEVEVDFGEIRANPEELYISAEMLRQIHLAIATLPPRCRLIFRLVKEDGFKYREVADMLNLSVKTIETQMSIALSKIGGELLGSRVFPQYFPQDPQKTSGKTAK